jgi:hypothetical protein
VGIKWRENAQRQDFRSTKNSLENLPFSAKKAFAAGGILLV